MSSIHVLSMFFVVLLTIAVAEPLKVESYSPESLIDSSALKRRSDQYSPYISEQRQYDPYAQQYSQYQARDMSQNQEPFGSARYYEPSQYMAKSDFGNVYDQREMPQYDPSYQVQERSMYEPAVSGYGSQGREDQNYMAVPSVSQRNIGYGNSQIQSNKYASRGDDYQPQYSQRGDGDFDQPESDPSMMMGREYAMPQSQYSNVQSRSMDYNQMGMGMGMMDPMQQMQMSQRQLPVMQSRDDNFKAQRAFYNSPYATREDDNPMFMTREDDTSREDFKNYDYQKRDDDDDAAREDLGFPAARGDDDTDDSARQDPQDFGYQGRGEDDDDSMSQREQYDNIGQRAYDSLAQLFPRSSRSDQLGDYNSIRQQDPMQMAYDYIQRNSNPFGSSYNYRSMNGY